MGLIFMSNHDRRASHPASVNLLGPTDLAAARFPIVCSIECLPPCPPDCALARVETTPPYAAVVTAVLRVVARLMVDHRLGRAVTRVGTEPHAERHASPSLLSGIPYLMGRPRLLLDWHFAITDLHLP